MDYNVVAINQDGQIVGVSPYDFTNNSGRQERMQAAADLIVSDIGATPVTMGGCREIIGEDGISWGRMTTQGLKIGMVEIGFGKWGFE